MHAAHDAPLPMAELIRAEIEEGLVERAVFGTSEPERIAAMLEDLVGRACRASVAGGLFYRSSVGCAAGLALANGAALVVKAHQAQRSAALLGAVARVQERLAEQGFPCASPVAEPVRIGAGFGFATFETYFPRPVWRRCTPVMLEVSARGLARLALLARDIDPGAIASAPAVPPPGALYPPPHSPIFDFPATAAGAEWIDAIAAEALEAMTQDDTPPWLMHGDWSAANVSLSERELLAAYDWDSLVWQPPSRPVGVAAATWSARGEEDDPVAPSAEEVRRYVEVFEAACGEFTRIQRWAAYASALYCLAYTARCEHALEPDGRRKIRARARLREEGTRLLRECA